MYRGECKRRIGEIIKWVRRMGKLMEVIWESIPKSWCIIGYGAPAELYLLNGYVVKSGV